MIKAIITDFDGTLVDTFEANFRAYQEAFARFRTCFAKMTDELTRCRYLKVLKGKQEEQDVGKLLISVKGTGLTGKSLYDILLSEYGLQVEMASVSFILAMFTVSV